MTKKKDNLYEMKKIMIKRDNFNDKTIKNIIYSIFYALVFLLFLADFAYLYIKENAIYISLFLGFAIMMIMSINSYEKAKLNYEKKKFAHCDVTIDFT